MPETVPSPLSEDQRRQDRNDAINRFLQTFAPSEDHDQLYQMVVTVCRLAADGADRGDLKILNSALKELRYAFKIFAPYAGVRKVTMFGSARTKPDHPQYEQAKRFAELIQEAGWMVITGAGDGIMRAGHHGATRAASFGVAISLPFEQATNDVIADDDKLVNFKYFFTRKLIFVKEANAIVLFPGGFGTQDEGYEALTLIQTLKATPTPIVLCDEPGGTYWVHWREWVEKELLGGGMIDPEDVHLFRVTDDAQEAVNEVVTFFERYHSSRWVNDKFVIRLNDALTEEQLAELTEAHADVLTDGGRFEQRSGPLDGEENEHPDKTRLVFPFNRSSAGRLRLLIDKLNQMV